MAGGNVLINGWHTLLGQIALTADKLSNCIVVQDVEHHMLHEGVHYVLAHHFSDVDSSGYARIRFKTPTDKYLHAVLFSAQTAGALFTVYRAPGFTHDAGNVLASINRNDVAAVKTANPDVLQEACHTPAGAGAGTVFLPTLPVGAGGNPSQSGSGSSRDSNEVILDVDTVYLIEAQSLSDNNKITIGCDFYYRES